MQNSGEMASIWSQLRCHRESSRSCGASLRRSLRYHTRYSGHSHDVAGDHGQLEVMIDAPDSPKHGLADTAHGLAPAKMLLNALSDGLADPIACVSGRARVDRTATTAFNILSHMGCHIAFPAGGDEIGTVVGFIGTHSFWARSGHGIEHRQGRYAFPRSVGVGDQCPHHQPRAVLHKHMALVAQRRGRVVALPEQSCIGVGGALMSVVAARLALPVGLGVASTATAWGLVIGAVFGSKALVACPSLNQSAIDREVFLREQPGLVGQAHDFGEERFDHLVRKQPIPVLGEHRVVPHRVVNGHSHKPAKQQVVAQLLDDLPLRSHRVEHLQQQRTQQLLRSDRLTPGIGVDRIEQTIESAKRFVHQPSDRAQRMIRRNEVLQLGYRE